MASRFPVSGSDAGPARSRTGDGLRALLLRERPTTARVCATRPWRSPGIGDPEAAAIASDAPVVPAGHPCARGQRGPSARGPPVVPLRDGRWVPYFPTQADGSGPTEEIHPGEDAGPELGATTSRSGQGSLIAASASSIRARAEAGWIVEQLEDVQFPARWLVSPIRARGENALDPFEQRRLREGCRAVLRAHPSRPMRCATTRRRSCVRGSTRSRRCSIRRTSRCGSNFAANGAWNKTHEERGTSSTRRARLLLTERGDRALARSLRPRARGSPTGKHIAVTNAPTRFGLVGYRIESHVAAGRIDVEHRSAATQGAERPWWLRLRPSRGARPSARSPSDRPRRVALRLRRWHDSPCGRPRSGSFVRVRY